MSNRGADRSAPPVPAAGQMWHTNENVVSMARGFESKDVEFQQAEAERGRSTGRELTSAEREAHTKRRTLELALTRAGAVSRRGAIGRAQEDAARRDCGARKAARAGRVISLRFI